MNRHAHRVSGSVWDFRSSARRYRPALDALEDRVVLTFGPVSLGAAAQYGVLGLANTKIVNSNGTVFGDVGVSAGGTLKNMAPSTITGSVFESSQGQYSGPGRLGGGITVDPALLSQANQDAANASSQAAALAPTQTFGAVSSPTTVVGNGGFNVVNVNGAIKSSLTLSGTPNDVFVVNVTGTLSLTGSSALGLGGGVTADHVLYNFTGAGYTISTHVGNVLNGTLLALHCNFSLDGAFNGEIIGGGGSITLLSGARVNEIPFSSSPGGTASLSGYVYADFSNDGVRDPGEFGIQGVVVRLTGVDDLGNAVTIDATTDGSGLYSFTGLSAGSYTIERPHPLGYIDGQTTVGLVNGSTDGVIGANQDITQIVLAADDEGTEYDFAEVFAGS